MLIIHQLTAYVNQNKNFPQILTRTHNQTLNLSDTAILTCHVRNLNNHHVTWLKYDRNTSTFLPLTVGEQVFLSDQRYSVSSYSISSDNSYWNLEIYNTQLSDEGIYECKISNRRHSVSIKIHLSIQIPMIIQPSRLYVEPGSEVELDCMIYNINTSSITWHFSSYNHTYHYNHYQYDIHEKYQHEKNISKSQLIIHHAQPYHSGLWTCTYKRQKRSARILVEKGAMQRLLSNNHSSSNIQCTMSLILFATFTWSSYHTKNITRIHVKFIFLTNNEQYALENQSDRHFISCVFFFSK